MSAPVAKWPEGPTPANLVPRLRAAEQQGREIIEPWDCDPYLYGEAADEIERLRAALEASTELLVTTLHPGGAEQYDADIQARCHDNRTLISGDHQQHALEPK